MATKLADTILEKQMDRRAFLKYIGSLFLAIIGVTNLMRVLSKHNLGQATKGYGASSYGGKKILP